ncbi:dihydropteroate synthase [Galenea microaerophila]
MNRWQQFLDVLSLEAPLVMGILNVTPDSFSDGGHFQQLEAAKRQAEKMLMAGADLIDVGGESTRPGARPVPLQAELDRVMPVIEMLKQEFGAVVSVDTYKPAVMQAAIELGVDMINDVNALQAPGAVEVVVQNQKPVCLMHKQGSPEQMQQAPHYESVVEEVIAFLQQRAEVCQQAGLDKSKIMLDPGFGFGKTLAHNIELFEELDQLIMLKYPVLVGVSRKSMIGQLMGEVLPDQRMIGSVTAAVLAALKGAKLLRVHDVKETKQALDVALALV